MRYVILTCMKNEAMFAVEWIAYHRAIGFEQIVVFTNDNDDNTRELLALLDKQGVIELHDNKMNEDEKPQPAALRQGLALSTIADAEWVMHSDTDEFLNITKGTGHISELEPELRNADCMAFLWRSFGDAGFHRWNGGLVHERFRRTHSRILDRIAFHKCMWRPKEFRSAHPHMPKDPVKGDAFRVVNAKGDKFVANAVQSADQSRFRMKKGKLTFDNAQMNHYAIKSTDLYLMKNHRGTSNSRLSDKYYLNSPYHRNMNHVRVVDDSILTKTDAFHEAYEALLSMPGVQDEIRKGEDWFYTMRDKILTPKQIEEWTMELPEGWGENRKERAKKAQSA